MIVKMRMQSVLLGGVLLLSLIPQALAEDDVELAHRLGRECQAGGEESCRRLAELARHAPEPRVRLAAVEKLGDVALLEEIAEKDSDKEVRLMAAQAIVCEQLFRECQSGSLESCERLAQYAEQGEDPILALAALWRIKEPEAWARIVKNSPLAGVRARIAGEASEAGLLAELAMNDRDAAVILAAIGNPAFSDGALLAQLAQSCPQAEVRLAVAQKLSDPALLAAVARSDESVAVRLAAVHNPFLTDPAALAEIAQADADAGVALAAVGRLTDLDLLALVARQGVVEEARLLAAEKIPDRELRQPLLVTLAGSAQSTEVRAAAVRQVTDPPFLAAIAKGDSSLIVARAALDRLTDQHLLAEVVRDAVSSNIRRSAALKIKDPDLLVWIATESPSEELRLISFLRLDRSQTQELLTPDVASTLTKLGQERMDPSANLSSSNFHLDQSPADRVVCSVDIVNRSRIFHYRVRAKFSAGPLTRTVEAKNPVEPGGKASLSAEFPKSELQGAVDVAVEFDADVLFMPDELSRLTLAEEDGF